MAAPDGCFIKTKLLHRLNRNIDGLEGGRETEVVDEMKTTRETDESEKTSSPALLTRTKNSFYERGRWDQRETCRKNRFLGGEGHHGH